ncbi:MAG: ABC transporter permease, partial [Acidimicrobiales bacterium]
AEVIGERLPPTLLLMGTALALSSLVGVALGALAARRPYRAFDLTLTTTGLVGYATPAFWLAQLAVLTLGLRAGLFPVQGMTDARAENAGVAHVLDVAHHLFLPAMVLAFSEIAIVARLARANLSRVLDQDYVRTARAGGVGTERVLSHHALRNALLPVVTVIGARIGTLFSGAVLVETVFAWPGLGQLLITSTRTRDYPVLLALVLLVSVSVVVANLVTDLVCARIDPRIRDG